MRDAFGNTANHLGDSRIHMHSPELLSALAVVSDTALLYELSSQKANGAAQVWVELLTPSGLHATAYSHHSNVPPAQYVASSLDLPCSHCFVPLTGHNYTYRSVCNTSIVVCNYYFMSMTIYSIWMLQMGWFYFCNAIDNPDLRFLRLSAECGLENHAVRFMPISSLPNTAHFLSD